MSTDAAPPMVELRGVTKRFGGFVAVDSVSLQIRSAEFLTLLGPSGCGKTTLLRMIAGFETPSEGTVHLAGTDVTHTPPYHRDVNQVFQSYALFPHLTVEENIAFGLERKRLARSEVTDRVRRGIDLVALAGLEKRHPRELSGGQQQRVALARAIVCEPRVLLLDEPLAALDARLRRQMQTELKQLQRKLGLTFVFVTHDQEEALTMSDRIAVVNHGRIEQIGDAHTIYQEPRTRFVAHFVGETNLLPATVIARKHDRARVHLDAALTLEVRSAQLPEHTERVLLSIRPEKIHLQPASSPAAINTFEAVITDEVFKGASAQLTLRHSSGLQLTCSVANESAHAQPFRRGDRVYFSLHPLDLVVLRE